MKYGAAASLGHLCDITSGTLPVWTDWVNNNLIQNRGFESLEIPQDACLEQRNVAKYLLLNILGDGRWV